MKYELNNIYNEDSYKAIKDMPNNSVDLIIIDPPYLTYGGGLNNKVDLGKRIQNRESKLIDQGLYDGIDPKIFPELVRIQKNINIYIWASKKQIPELINYFVVEKKCNYEILIWIKNNGSPLFNKRYLTDKEYLLYFRKNGLCDPQSYKDAKTIFTSNVNKADKKSFNHPTIKPLNIISTLIRNSSRPGEVVADFFVGSGTTCVAAKELGRQYIGFEIDKAYYKIAKDRLNGITASGQTSMFTDFEEIL